MIKKKSLEKLETTLKNVAWVVRGFATTQRTPKDEQHFFEELNAVVHHYLLGDFIYASLGIPMEEIEDLGI